MAVADYGKNLRYLGLTGLFRFRRLPQELFIDIINSCTELKVVTIKECPDLDPALIREIQQEKPWLKIIM